MEITIERIKDEEIESGSKLKEMIQVMRKKRRNQKLILGSSTKDRFQLGNP
jgi:hypothetical protein